MIKFPLEEEYKVSDGYKELCKWCGFVCLSPLRIKLPHYSKVYIFVNGYIKNTKYAVKSRTVFFNSHSLISSLWFSASMMKADHCPWVHAW